jgi:tetratricopeptide (TPR) repeat protein
MLYVVYATISMKIRDFPRAIEAYQHALGILKNPELAKSEDIDFLQLLYLTAIAYLENDQTGSAAEYAAKMLALDTDNAQAKKFLEAINYTGLTTGNPPAKR